MRVRYAHELEVAAFHQSCLKELGRALYINVAGLVGERTGLQHLRTWSHLKRTSI